MIQLVIFIFLLLAGPVGAEEYEWYLLQEGGIWDNGEALIESHCFVVHQHKYEPVICTRAKPATQDNIGKAIVELARGRGFNYVYPCLAQMEQAMRAMEPWVSITGYGSMQAYERGRIDGITAESPDEMKRLVERFVTATKPLIMQWNEAKRDCWRTP